MTPALRAALAALALTLGCAPRATRPIADPPPWPTRLDDIAWLEGRWAGRDASGVCHVEHWLAPRDGSMWVARLTDGVAAVERITAADLGARGERAAVIADAHYRRVDNRLAIDGGAHGAGVRELVRVDEGALSSSCPRP